MTGEHVRSGTFRVDRGRLLAKLGDFALAEPEAYLP